ncbi:arginine deiminase [Fructilactobacillus fructivorans]|uniref:Arginine deiminase n=1 Tax=Fructilactobacillus fructivorans TaxID=1614 RepID=A0AAE6P0N8_9LACO|nr:arginine deiminase [Fructilactobacillus fructivorans]KRK58136.1 arginine deiminase [Fructilactobacillus fructivorans]KRN41368.1 arginine deiminase [Fructilactobacillus fructivorans]KRN42831.1 arginine deiminase [Fructilactobacillus fructivorans]QFX92135.1 arginine deiminase [Fructilactobacillus fructivorans]RDV65183.1 arginine deiminase [Fructilactobacillus fructivorans]
MKSAIEVNSEIGRLKSVLLHRPGKEIENITPATMKRMLFDDVPFQKIADEEHDYFAHLLRDQGVETVYIEDLLEDVLQDDEVRDDFLTTYLAEHYYTGKSAEDIKKYFETLSIHELVSTIYAGLRRDKIHFEHPSLHEVAGPDAETPFLLDPLPNAYFTRDPQASMGSGLTINRMTFEARRPESLITEYVMKYHPRFAGKIDVWLDRYNDARIEGGDELVLNDHVVAIGCSQRTSTRSIEKLAHRLFDDSDSHFDTIVAVEIPHNHAMMHLDTVFTMVNYDQFTVFPGIMHGGKMNINILHPGNDHTIKMEHRTSLPATLKEVLGLSEIDLMETGNGDPVAAPREQWNDGSNNLAIAPGEVVTYDRNYVSIKVMREHGIKVHEIFSSELSRGRGGARCMSQPIVREPLNN